MNNPLSKNSFSKHFPTFNKHRTWVIIASGASLIYLLGIIAAVVLSAPSGEIMQVFSTPKPAVKHYSPLTGIEVDDEAATTQPVTAVMIENSPDARPQSGLREAGVVFEAVAEGGITRFLAVYQESKPELIGPVRSVRPYYIDWAAAFNPSIAHVGGSPEALSEIRNGKYRDIDQFFNAGSYWRASDRYAPHNVYTSSKKLDETNKQKGYLKSEFSGFTHQDPKVAGQATASTVTINLSSALYNTSYSYNAKQNNYRRSLAGEAHLDREKGQIAPDSVIAMKVNQSTGYYRNVDTIGSGEVVIFQNGIATQGTWKKSSKTSQIKFSDTNGKDIGINRGQAWVVAVPNGQGSIQWQ